MAKPNGKAQKESEEDRKAAALAYVKVWHPVTYTVVIWALLWLGTGLLHFVSLVIGLVFRSGGSLPWVPFWDSTGVALLIGVGGGFAWRGYERKQQRKQEAELARERRVMLAEIGLPDPGVEVLAKQAEEDAKSVDFCLQSFETVCRTKSLQALEPGEEEKSIPVLTNARCTIDRDVTAHLRTAGGNGITIKDIRANADRFAEIAGAPRFRVRNLSTPGEAQVTWLFSDPLDRIVRVQDLPLPKQRGNAVVGITENADGMELSTNKPTANVGNQGSGKSNVVKAKLASLLGQGLYVEAYIINPKKAEWRQYATAAGYQVDDVQDVITRPDNPEWRNQLRIAAYAELDHAEGLEVVEAYYARVMKQAGVLASAGLVNGVTQTQIGDTPDNPYIWFINDEGGDYLKEEQQGSANTYGLAKQKARFTGAGWDACFITLNEQSLKEGRKFYANRVGFKSEETTAIAVFGPSLARDAKLSEISENTPGVGVYVDPERNQLVRFKGAVVTPADEVRMADGLAPEGMGAGSKDVDEVENWYVYVLPDIVGDTPYVGMTGREDPWSRIMEHKEDKPWFDEVHLPDVQIIRRDSEAKARRLEYLCIKHLRPFYNDQHNRDNPRRIDWKRDGYTPRKIGLSPAILAEEAATRRWPQVPRVTLPKMKREKVAPLVAEPVLLAEEVPEPEGVVQDDGSLLSNLQAQRYRRTKVRSAA